MRLVNLKYIFLKYFYGNITVFAGVFITFLVGSCQNKETKGYSKAFKPVFDTVTVFFETNRLNQGLRYLDYELKRISNPTIDDRFRAYAFHFVSEYKAKKDNKKALLYADSMLNLVNEKINQDERYIPDYAEANFAMGDAYFNLGQYDEAYQHFFKGYAAGRNSLNTVALAEYNYRMGMITYKLGNYKAATGFFKKCYQFQDEKNNSFVSFYNKQEILDNIGLSYKHRYQNDSAIVYFNKALKFIDEHVPQFPKKLSRLDVARGVIYGNKADVLILKGDTAGAIAFLKKSIAINLKKHNDYNDALLTEIKLARIFYDQNNNNSLFSLLKVMRPQVDTMKNEAATADWNRLMSNYYHRKKDYRNAFEYLQTYNTVKDSIIKEQSLLRESNLNKQVDNYEKQYEIDNLINNNKIQRIYLYVAIICVLMVLIIIFLVFRNWKRSKKEVQVVNSLNQQIKDQYKVLENTLNELNISSQEKDRILRTVAHDLRNPLGGIAALTKVMNDENYSENQKEMIGLINDTSTNSLQLINELLEVANNDAVELNKELVDINQLLHNSIELLRFKANEKNQQIILEPTESPVELWISREKIWRVTGNLITNAIKFSPIGGVIFTKISVHEKHVEILIKDTGIGIPDHIKNKVFNMFTEAKRLGTAGEKSFGLGLSISKQIIERHKGKIWFESEVNKGTTFFVSLPKS